MIRYVLAVGVVASACGDSLTDSTYRGAPIFKLEGQITNASPLPPDLVDEAFGVSIFWAPRTTFPDPDLVEQSSVTTAVSFPSNVELRVFEPPNDEHFGSSTAGWVVGLVLVYVDADVDGAFDERAGDRLVGGSISRGIVYARTALGAGQSPNGVALDEGFATTSLPLDQSCGALPFSPVSGSRQGGPPGSCRNGCGPFFTCDDREFVCVPVEAFVLSISSNFSLRSAICRPD